MCTAVQLPGISIGRIPVYNPNATIHKPGDKVTYDELSIRFKVDEDMTNYEEIFGWVTAMGRPLNSSQFAEMVGSNQRDLRFDETQLYSDATLLVMTSHRNPRISLKFVDVFPNSLTPIEFNTQDTDIEYVEASATFAYRNFTIERLS